jgi:drug/metabolite transporter (DMT)-like permease
MQNNHKKIFQATLFVATSGILYGFLGFLGTGILRENIPISTMLFWRFIIAGSWIFLFVIRKYLIKRAFCPIDTRTLFFTFLLGAVGYAGSSGFYFIASQYTGTGLAMVIFFSFPIIVALASWMKNRENINAVTIFTLISMITGLFLLRDSPTHQFNTIGIFFGIVAAICYAFYVMGSKRISSTTVDSNLLTTIVCLGCAFIFLMLSISSHTYVFPHSIKSWLYLLALGIFATALPIQLMLEGLRYISSMRASIISVLEPLVTVFVGVLLLDESISHLQIFGISIILVSTVLVQFQRKL